MNYMGNKEYWEEKFKNRSDNLLKPEKTLVENLKYFKKGSVLDVACGDGRNTMFLIENGFKVTGIDFCDEAIKRLRRFVKRGNYLVNIIQADLDEMNFLDNIGVYDNILVNHFKLNEEQIINLKNHIIDGGILFVCSFGEKQVDNFRIEEKYLIRSSDFSKIQESFNLINYIETQDERGFVVTYLFKKKNRNL